MANDYYTRIGSYQKGSLARGDVVKSDFDALVTAWDSGETNIKRALKLPEEGSPQTDWQITENATNRAGKALGFDTSGNLELQTGVGNWKGTWATSTAYALRDVVVDGAAGASTDNLYICIEAHTSGTWATDLSAAKWELMVNVSEARDWAQKTDGIVDSTGYSSKAWAIGGTDVSDTASRGAAKEWAIETSGTVDTAEYSAKEYAQGTQASTGGSAKDYAQKTDGGVSGATSDHSAKAWAVGGTGITSASSKGAAKEWATTTGAYVDTAEYSAKEYAIGTTATSAKDYATKTSAAVTGSEFSAKEYAQGTQASTGGSAKDYAQKTDGGVSGATSDHSAKAWAVGGTGITNTAGKGASKEWAITAEDITVDGTSYSSLHWASKSSGSATSASSSASSATSSAISASTSASSASSTLTTFQTQYMGSHSSAPSTSTVGALYWNSTAGNLNVWDGSSWVAIQADTDVKVSVSSNDTTPGYLNGKLVAGTSVTLTEGSDGGDETLTVALDSATVVAKTSATGSGQLPSGTTAQRDGSPSAGMIRYNSTTAGFEGYGAAWGSLDTTYSAGTGLNLATTTFSLNTGNANTWTAAQRGEITALTSATTITIDMADSNNFSCTLAHNATFANPSNLTAGQSGSIFLIQDGSGSRTASWGSNFDFAGGTAPTLTTTASAVDRIDYVVLDSSNIHAVATLNLS